jgi:heterodisulfide reductase subunit C
MGAKAYFMINIAKRGGNGYVDALADLEAMPEVEFVAPVSGQYDFMVKVDAPTGVVQVANKILEMDWVKHLDVLKIEPYIPKPFLEEVCSIPGGETVNWCAQCGMCSASCPNVARMDYSPRKIIALIRAGKREQVLSSNTMSVCASCYLCTARCPEEVKITELMHALECLAVRHGLRGGRTPTTIMHRAFTESIKKNGRVHEVGLMFRFYLRTNPFAALRLSTVGLKLFSHGRMPLRARKIKGTEQIKAIIDKARALGGA